MLTPFSYFRLNAPIHESTNMKGQLSVRRRNGYQMVGALMAGERQVDSVDRHAVRPFYWISVGTGEIGDRR